MKWIVSVIIAAGCPAFAAPHTTGNGGDAVVCRDKDFNIKTAELLDYYEGRILDGHPSTLDPSQTTAQNIQVLLGRMNFYDQYFHDILADRAVNFENEANLLPGNSLVDIPDSDHWLFPAGCAVEQVAIQAIPAGSRKFYTVSKDIWDKLDSANQAGLVMHEIIYRNFTEAAYLDLNSSDVRAFNAIVAADHLKLLGFQAYVIYLKKLFVPYTNINGFLADVTRLTFTEGRLTGYQTLIPNLTELDLYNGFKLVVKNVTLKSDEKHGKLVVDLRAVGDNRSPENVGFIQDEIRFEGRTYRTLKSGIQFEFDLDIKRLSKIQAYAEIPLEVFGIQENKSTVLPCSYLTFTNHVGDVSCNRLRLKGEKTSIPILNDEGDNDLALRFITFNSQNFPTKAVAGLPAYFDSDDRTPDMDTGELIFDSSGKLKSLTCLGPVQQSEWTVWILNKVSPFFQVERNGFRTYLNCRKGESPLLFDQDGLPGTGDVTSITRYTREGLLFGQEISLHCDGNKKTVSGVLYESYVNGNPKRGIYQRPDNSPYIFTMINGSRRQFQDGDLLEFDPSGRVISNPINVCLN